jgi:hypothetical protein
MRVTKQLVSSNSLRLTVLILGALSDEALLELLMEYQALLM